MQHFGCQSKKVHDLQNCQKEGEGQSEGSLFPLFLISFYQVVLLCLAEVDGTAGGTPLCPLFVNTGLNTAITLRE